MGAHVPVGARTPCKRPVESSILFASTNESVEVLMGYSDPEVNRKYQRERNMRIRTEWLLRNGPCRSCGNPDRLEVDHVDPGQKVSHEVWSWSKLRREAELAKCQVLCHECHLSKTSAARALAVEHGTLTMYQNYGCRCRPCVNSKMEEKRRNGWK